MQAPRQVTDADYDAISQIVNDDELKQQVMKALVTMQHMLFGWGNPVDQHGCIGAFAYHYAASALGAELMKWRFQVVTHGGQLRVMSKNFKGHRVSFVAASGRGSDNAVRFNAEKGAVTHISALENRAFGQKVRPSLFDFDPALTRINPLDHLNFGVVYKFTVDTLDAWMFFGTEFLSKIDLECLEVAYLGQSQFNPANIPDIGLSRPPVVAAEYYFDELREREDDQATGT